MLADGAQAALRVALATLDLDQAQLARADLDLVEPHLVAVPEGDQRGIEEHDDVALVDEVAEAPFIEVHLALHPAVLGPGYELLAHVVPLFRPSAPVVPGPLIVRRAYAGATRGGRGSCSGVARRRSRAYGRALRASAASAGSAVLTM